jgi:hypothetical protein
MSQIILPVDPPSPNVGSGLKPPYGIPSWPIQGVDGTGVGSNGLGNLPPDIAGTGVGPNGLAGGTMTDDTVAVIPSTIAVPAISVSSPNVRSGLVGAAQLGQAATTIPAEPSQG